MSRRPVVDYVKLDLTDPRIASLVEMSTTDAWLGHGAVIALRSDYDHAEYVGFWIKGDPVGFALARLDIEGRYRTGPIFVAPGWRGMEIASGFIQTFFQHRRGIAWIAPNNTKSKAAFAKGGFHPTAERAVLDNMAYQQYLKD